MRFRRFTAKRYMFDLLAGALFLAAMGMLALWLATYWWFIQLSYGYGETTEGISQDRTFGAFANISALNLSYAVGPPGYVGPHGWSLDVASQKDVEASHWSNGLWFYYQSGDLIFRDRQLGIPFWALATVFLIAPVLWC